MGSLHKWNKNPFQDFLLKSIIFDADISDKKLREDIYNAFVYFLQNVLDDENDIVHLDFKITSKNDYFKVIGNNAITAVWLSGMFPKRTEQVLKNNTFVIGKRKYTYNEKTCKLTYVLIKTKE